MKIKYLCQLLEDLLTIDKACNIAVEYAALGSLQVMTPSDMRKLSLPYFCEVQLRAVYINKMRESQDEVETIHDAYSSGDDTHSIL